MRMRCLQEATPRRQRDTRTSSRLSLILILVGFGEVGLTYVFYDVTRDALGEAAPSVAAGPLVQRARRAVHHCRSVALGSC